MTQAGLRARRALVALYPYDFRARFASAMLGALDSAAADRREAGFLARIRFVFEEIPGLALGCLAEWLAKLAADRSARGRYLPDLRLMRQPGVGHTEWFGG